MMAFLAGFIAFPVVASVVGVLVWRHDRKVMRGHGAERDG